MNIYNSGLDKNPANYSPLTPLSFIQRAAQVFPQRLAVVHGTRRFTWRQAYERSVRLASALHRHGIGIGDTVACLLANTPEMFEAHHGVPMLGAVINTLNTRLDAATIAFSLDHGEARALLVDREFSALAQQALAQASVKPLVIDVHDPVYAGPGERIGVLEYEALLDSGDPHFAWGWPEDEWEAIALSYTSGTTGNPKGVVTHHRGAYLNAMGNALTWALPHHATYLWTLPMFHCNGWCFPWTTALNAGVNVCLRKVEAATIFELIRVHRVTHFCGAPIVHSTLINAPDAMKQGIDWPVHGLVAGAAPPAAMIEGMAKMGWNITHVYGLTEVYGPASVCAKQTEWDSLSLSDQVAMNGRQGVRYAVQDGMTVMDPTTMQTVPADGQTMGEIMFRGNIVMKGYLKNPAATAEAFAGGWFHSGDLAVLYPDGYAKIKDRAKDIIISGGENISSIEVEDALYRHPAVLACGVVAQPDPKWGESPLAFVELKEGAAGTVTQADLITHCKGLLAGFKVPKEIRFCVVPKTSTGKIQKFALREQARSTQALA
jgi:fatty-acyl-CoA synthase